MRKFEKQQRLQGDSVAEIAGEFAAVTARLAKAVRFGKRKVQPGPLLNALVLRFLGMEEEEQRRFAARALAELEMFLAETEQERMEAAGRLAVVSGPLPRVRTEAELDEASRITPGDIEGARDLWRRSAPAGFEELLDAGEVPPDDRGGPARVIAVRTETEADARREELRRARGAGPTSPTAPPSEVEAQTDREGAEGEGGPGRVRGLGAAPPLDVGNDQD